MARWAFDFTPQDEPGPLSRLLAWLLVIGVAFALLRCCVVPVCRSIGEAMKKEARDG